MRVAALVSGVVVCLGLGASALAASERLTFTPRWQVVSHRGVATDGPYTILWSHQVGVAGALINELTGHRTRVMLPAGCPSPVGGEEDLGDTWLVVACPRSSVSLYALATGLWRTMALPAVCGHHDGTTCTPAAVGTNWIKYDEASVNLGDRWLFQNVVTGAVRNDPTNAHTLPDLDSPLLTKPVCAPLRVPSARSQSTLQFEGRFAILTTNTGIFLEHCATHLHRLLTDSAPWATAARAEVVWISRPTRPFDGIFLPGRRRFTVSPPSGANMFDVVIGARHIYVVGDTRRGASDVWGAPLSALRRS